MTPHSGRAMFVGHVSRAEPVTIGGGPAWIPVVEAVGRQLFVRGSWLMRY
jgi:hypothetical protein